ncbi:MAG: DUF1849 family protein [Alphaproteobacteria bacterium]|nr:DUF1849 family protein [Alphaproteobacteria bacterium]
MNQLLLRLAAAAAFLALVPGVGPADAAGAIKLKSHKAIYDLRLGQARSGSNVADYRGRMVVEWRDTCAGYTLSQRLVSRLVDAEGGAFTSDLSVASWESHDLQQFRFTTNTQRDGEPPELVAGRARRGAADKPAKADFTKPESKSVEYPADTMFPTEHSLALIEGARAGQPVVAATVFDGGGPDKIYRVVAFVGPRSTPREEPPDLSGRPSWKLRLAYFPAGKDDGTPEYELGYRMYDNGIASELVLDYGDFTVDSTLSSLELLPEPSCN